MSVWFEDLKHFYNHLNVQDTNIKNVFKENYQFKSKMNLSLLTEDLWLIHQDISCQCTYFMKLSML